jgi:hypothetical protein
VEQAHSLADSRPSNFEYRLGPAGAIGGVDTSGDGGYTWVSKDLFSDELIWDGDPVVPLDPPLQWVGGGAHFTKAATTYKSSLHYLSHSWWSLK